MENLRKTFKILIMLVAFLFLTTTSIAKNITNDYLMSGDPYYKLWDGEFLMYVDNYKGDTNDVSLSDLNSNNGTSSVYFFNKLQDGDYNYDVLLADIRNKDKATNLHEEKSILILLPKSAKSYESHALLKSNDEKGKLFYGGPYDKYASYKNGFYYKNKLLTNDEVEKVLADFKSEALLVSKAIKDLKKFSIKDLYKNVKSAYMTNGSSVIAGTEDSKIYKLDIDKKYSPYNFGFETIKSSSIDTICGKATENVLQDWDVCSIYLFSDDAGKKLINKISIYEFKMALWDKQK